MGQTKRGKAPPKKAPAKKKVASPGDSVLAKDVEAKKVRWLWRERIPLGMITLLAGRPDQGKGLVSAHIAADVSRRGGNVLYSAVEDDMGLMTRPRLESAGADLNRILLWRFMVPSQFEELEAHVVENKIRLVVMDPLAAHLGSGISQHSDSIRKVTNPMSALAERTECSFVIIAHALKRVPKNSHPLSAIGGSSSGLPAAARMAFIFGVDPEDSERRILAPAKHNIRDKPKALAFETDSEEIGLVGEVPNLTVQGETEFDPMRLLGDNGEPNKVGRRPDKRAAAAEWLTQYLADKGKAVKAGLVMEDAKQYGLTSKTVRRAADDMGVVRQPPGGGRNCTWDLPGEVKQALGIGGTTNAP